MNTCIENVVSINCILSLIYETSYHETMKFDRPTIDVFPTMYLYNFMVTDVAVFIGAYTVCFNIHIYLGSYVGTCIVKRCLNELLIYFSPVITIIDLRSYQRTMNFGRLL